jgi:hypothetical protein
VIHQVVWSDEAYRSLAEIWEASYDREVIAHAIDEVLAALGEDAADQGESRSDGLRIFFASPLAVLYWANERTTDVSIRAVWAYD